MTNAFTAKPKVDPAFLKEANAALEKQRAGRARAKQPGAAKTFSNKVADKAKAQRKANP